jgi:hypothetical protein
MNKPISVTVACILGLAITGAAEPSTLGARSASVENSCVGHHANVTGNDSAQPATYGNEGNVYVNTQTTLNSLQNNIYRSLFVIGPGVDNNGHPLNDVEVGWTAGDGLFSNTPIVYAEWINNGVDSYPQNSSYVPTTDAFVHLRVENVGNKDIWRFVIGGQSQPFNYSPTMVFNTGWVLTNSEHWNSCDSLYASFRSLDYSGSLGTWTTSYQNYKCYIDTSTDWYFHKNSNSSSDVTTDSSTC